MWAAERPAESSCTSQSLPLAALTFEVDDRRRHVVDRMGLGAVGAFADHESPQIDWDTRPSRRWDGRESSLPTPPGPRLRVPCFPGASPALRPTPSRLCDSPIHSASVTAWRPAHVYMDLMFPLQPMGKNRPEGCLSFFFCRKFGNYRCATVRR